MRVLNLVFIGMMVIPNFVQASEKFLEPIHLTLQRAMVLAYHENVQIFAANERVRQAVANISLNRAGLLPQLTGSLGGKRQTVDLRSSGINIPGDPHVGPFNSFDTRGRLSMDIFNLAVIKRLDSAKAGEQLSQAQILKVRQDILAMVGALFLEAQRSNQGITLNEVYLSQAKRQYQLAQLHLKQGTGSVSDFNQSKVDLSQAQYTLEASKARALQTRLDFVSALRIPLEQPIIFKEDSSWMKKDLEQPKDSPDVKVSQAQLAQSKASEIEAKAGFWPKITASGDYGRSGESPSQSSNTYSLGLAVSVPVWEGGSKQAQVDIAKSKVRENQVLLEDAKQQNQAKIENTKYNLIQAKAFLKTKMQQRQYTLHEYEVAVSRLKSGLGNQLDMDEAASGLASATDEKNEAQALYWTARINLAHVMGNIEELMDIQKTGD